MSRAISYRRKVVPHFINPNPSRKNVRSTHKHSHHNSSRKTPRSHHNHTKPLSSNSYSHNTSYNTSHNTSRTNPFSSKTYHTSHTNHTSQKSREPSIHISSQSKHSTNNPSLFHPSTTSNRSNKTGSVSQTASLSTKILPALPTLEFNEKPAISLQYEVSQSKPPNLNLSTYGYSVNARDTTRHKALHDAIQREGLTSVKTRLSYLVEKYEKEVPVMNILLDDYEWTDDYGYQMENRRKLEQERNKSRKKLYNRMQEKSKSKHYHRRR